MVKEFVNKTGNTIKTKNSYGTDVLVAPGDAIKLAVTPVIFDGIDFAQYTTKQVENYFNGTFYVEAKTDDKCICDSFDVVNFGCKCGGK